MTPTPTTTTETATSPDRPRDRRRPQILRGETPDAVHIPSGCRFHPRCPIAIEDCKRVDPKLERPVAGRTPTHRAACIRV